jgi:hypothetical protein
VAKNHRTVRWCTGLSGESSAPTPKSFSDELVALGKRREHRNYNSPDCPVSQSRPSQRSAAKSTGDTWPESTVDWAHRTVRCAPDCVGAPTGPLAQRSDAPDKEGGRAPDCYRTCPVRHSTKGKNCLPS